MAIDLNPGQKEFIGLDNRLVREQVIDYLFNNYEVTGSDFIGLRTLMEVMDIHPMFSKKLRRLYELNDTNIFGMSTINKELKNYLKFYSEDLLEGAFRRLNNMISS